jgi:hypothetical protein
VVGDGLLGRLDQLREDLGLAHSELSEDLAVHFDPGEGKPLDETVVGEAVRPGRGVDPGDPQLTELALARPAVAVGVDEGVQLTCSLAFRYILERWPR